MKCPYCGLETDGTVIHQCKVQDENSWRYMVEKRLTELEKRVNLEWGKAIQEEIDETHEALKANCDLQAENAELKQRLEATRRDLTKIAAEREKYLEAKLDKYKRLVEKYVVYLGDDIDYLHYCNLSDYGKARLDTTRNIQLKWEQLKKECL